MENSKIEWTDHTFNPWEGCTKVSPGCANCYAETRNARYNGGNAPNWGRGAPRRRTSEANWRKPIEWNREAAEFKVEHGHRPRVFCASLADWLDDEVPIEWFVNFLEVVHATPSLDWLLLTKRPENWQSRMNAAFQFGDLKSERHFDFNEWLAVWSQVEPGDAEAPKNVWIGTTGEDQRRAEERIPHLRKIPARVRFLSCEPLLGAVNLEPFGEWAEPQDGGRLSLDGIHWVIAGGESGRGARPMHPDWARGLRDQCRAADVSFFMKQMGGIRKPFEEIPADLMIREFPKK